jgi:hypothetical protein
VHNQKACVCVCVYIYTMWTGGQSLLTKPKNTNPCDILSLPLCLIQIILFLKIKKLRLEYFKWFFSKSSNFTDTPGSYHCESCFLSHFNFYVWHISTDLQETVWYVDTHTIFNDQIKMIDIPITSNVYHFFVLGTFKVLSFSYY